MASVIKAGNATDGVQVTSDNTGILELKTGTGAGTTAMTLDTTGNVNFPILGQRIIGDFSNATIANRVMFQTSTVNSATVVSAIPNGTSALAQIQLFNNSDPTNAGRLQFAVGSTEAQIFSNISGTGTYLPMTFYTGGSERMRIDTSGNLLVGTTSASAPSTTGFISTANTFGFKNRIINGGMVIDQRNAGASVATSSGSNFYTLDRWRMYQSQVSKYTVQQNQGSVTPPAGFSNYLGFTSSSAYTVGAAELFILQQFIEGFNIADLAWGTSSAQPVTLSFWVRSSLTGTFGGSLLNNGNARSYPFTYTINAANTWEQKSVTIAGDTSGTWLTNNGIGININFSLGTGSSLSGTAGAWSSAGNFSATGAVSVLGTNGATFYITGVQLEKGSTATSFDYRPYGTELALCQRYYYRLSIANQSMFSNGQCVSTTICFGLVQFPVPMRTAPTALEQSGTASHYTVYHSGMNTDCSVVPTYTTATTADNALVNFTVASGLTVGRAANQRSNNNAAYLGWSAEL